jgi:hypothetical protein
MVLTIWSGLRFSTSGYGDAAAYYSLTAIHRQPLLTCYLLTQLQKEPTQLVQFLLPAQMSKRPFSARASAWGGKQAFDRGKPGRLL